MPDQVIIELPYQATAEVRFKRQSKRIWGYLSDRAPVEIRSLRAAEAPLAGTVNGERFRIVDGRLHREVQVQIDQRFRPATIEDAAPNQKAPPLYLPLPDVGLIPWKQHEWDREDHGYLHMEHIAERFNDSSASARARLQRDAGEALVAVDDVLYIAAHPPVLTVHTSCRIGVTSAAELANENPRFSRYGGHYQSLFSLERIDDAVGFARLLAQRAGAGADNIEAPEIAADIAPGCEAFFRCDDLVSSARWNLPFSVWYPENQTKIFGSEGLVALGELRDACFALEGAEGRTRANARRAYKALAAMMNAPDGGLCGPNLCAEVRRHMAHVSSHLLARLEYDASFALDGDELTLEDDEALAGLTPRP